MRTHLRQFISTLRRTRLTDAERTMMSRDMQAFVASHPAMSVRVAAGRRHRLRLLIITRPMIASLAIIITLILGGGVSAAAENATPGDILYPVKIHVNEEVRAAIAVKPVAKAQVAAARAERRMDEIAALASEGKLDEKTKIAIEAKIESHTAEVQAQLATSGNAEESLQVRADIEARLKAKEKLLKKAHGIYSVKLHLISAIDILLATSTVGATTTPGTATTTPGTATTTPVMTTTTPPVVTTSTSSTFPWKKSPNVESAAKGKMKAAAHKIEEVKRFIDHAREKYGADAVARASIHLQSAQAVFTQGTTALDAGNYREAFRFFQEAHMKAQEAKLLIEFRKKFHLDIDIGNGTTTVSTSGGILIDIRKDKKEDKDEDEEKKEKREERREEMKEIKEDWKEQREEWKERLEENREKQEEFLEEMKELRKKNKR